MRNFTKFIFLFLIVGLASQVSAQTKRYLEPVFDEVAVSGVQFAGGNYTVVGWAFTLITTNQPGNTFQRPLAFQTYSPVGDTENARPLVIYLHTGNFFPFPQNGSCGGTRSDSTNVEIATRLAQMGYVVATVDYRVGWVPVAPSELYRRFTLINGAYRGVQDVNTYIRYFKRSVEEGGNPFGIDPDKIVVWGQGTGGYLSLATAYLNEYEEILNTSDPNKFKLDILDAEGNPGNPFDAEPGDGVFETPMVRLDANGDVNGEAELITVDPTYSSYSGLIPGDTLHVPNHQGFSNDFQLAVNMGGALGDSTWISQGEVPLVSFHVTTDPFAPYNTDVLLVPTPIGAQPVVEVSGSYDAQRSVTRFGLNDIFNSIPDGNDPFANGDDFSGLRSFSNTPNDSSSPWEWTDLSNPALQADDCNGDPVIAKTYIDTIVGFYAPRGCVALNLNCDFTTSVEDIELGADYLTISPNPARDYVNVTSDKAEIESIVMYSANGQVVYTQSNVNSRAFTIDRLDLPTGLYFIKANFEEGTSVQRIMLD